MAVLLLVIGVLLAGGTLLGAAGTVVRRQYEPQSWADGRCAESSQSNCIDLELAKSDLEAVRPHLVLALIGVLIAAGGTMMLAGRALGSEKQ